MRYGWLLGVVLFASEAWSGEPFASDLPNPEIAWIIENSAVGIALDDPNRLLFAGSGPSAVIATPDLPAMDLGIDLDYGRRLLEEAPTIEIVKPESLVGL